MAILQSEQLLRRVEIILQYFLLLKVYLGFNFRKGTNPTYVIKKYPSGTIVKPSAVVPSSGSGYISSYNRAILGCSRHYNWRL